MPAAAIIPAPSAYIEFVAVKTLVVGFLPNEIFELFEILEIVGIQRNISFKYGLKIGMILSGFDQIVLRGKAPWTLKHSEADHLSLKKKSEV